MADELPTGNVHACCLRHAVLDRDKIREQSGFVVPRLYQNIRNPLRMFCFAQGRDTRPMSNRTDTPCTALMAAIPLPTDAASAAPDWVHLLPAPVDGLVRTADSRGPYRLADAAGIIAASFATSDRLEIDVNHSTFLAAPRGERADAMGWICEMQAREDGIWGRVEWNAEGAALVTGKAYRGISPVIIHDAAKTILRIANASLVNRPNLQGLTALNFEQDPAMTLMERLAELLGLEKGATEEQILAALIERLKKKPEAEPAAALQSALTEIGTALGVATFTQDAVLAAARAARTARAAPEAEVVTALQSEIATLTTRLNSVTEGQKRGAAEAFVDGEIRRGRAGVKPLRDHYVAMHMADAARVEKELGALPILGPSNTLVTPPLEKDGEISLNAEQSAIATQLGIDPKAYAATLKAERAEKEAL